MWIPNKEINPENLALLSMLKTKSGPCAQKFAHPWKGKLFKWLQPARTKWELAACEGVFNTNRITRVKISLWGGLEGGGVVVVVVVGSCFAGVSHWEPWQHGTSRDLSCQRDAHCGAHWASIKRKMATTRNKCSTSSSFVSPPPSRPSPTHPTHSAGTTTQEGLGGGAHVVARLPVSISNSGRTRTRTLCVDCVAVEARDQATCGTHPHINTISYKNAQHTRKLLILAPEMWQIWKYVEWCGKDTRRYRMMWNDIECNDFV